MGATLEGLLVDWGGGVQACRRMLGAYREHTVLAGHVGSICAASRRGPALEAWGRG